MTSSRPSRSLYIVLVALLVLLPLLAVLQYRWIGEVSQAERRRLEEHVNEAGSAFAADFNRELARVLSTFQYRGSLDAPDLRQWFARQYDDSIASYPSLLRRVFLARRAGDDLNLFRFYPESRSLAAVDWPVELAPLRENLKTRLQFFARSAPLPVWEPLSSGNPSFPVPVLPPMPNGPPRDAFDRGVRPPAPQLGWTIVELDPKVLFEQLIPSIVSRHFATETADYRIAIISRSATPQMIYKSDANLTENDMRTPDVRIPLFAADIGRNRPAAKGLPQGPRPDGFRDDRRGDRLRSQFGGLRSLGGSMLAGSWELLLKHRSGSLDTAIASIRRHNLAISFGILLLLASSFVLVVISSHRARALAQLQMDFVARVSHELRTPLAIIRSAAYNVANGVVSDEKDIREYASMVQAEGQRLSTMVDQILTFSRTESGHDSYEPRPVAVGAIVDRVIDTMSSALTHSGCQVERNIAGSLPKVNADERALADCLQNLISNAMKYGRTEPVTRIRIEARRADSNTVAITVADSGTGIDAADLPHLFEPFFRGTNIRSETPGSGLGLNLVRRMMSAQGGRVAVESEPGQGARFTLYLTATAEEAS